MNNNNALNNLADTAREAFGRVQSVCPEDAKVIGTYLGALHKKNIIALGEGEAFALTDAEGRSIKATKRTVRLSAENGGLTQPVWNGPYVISAPGYAMLAHAAGAVIMNAPTVTVDGVAQQNPYVRRGPDGSIVEVHCRAMAFRYAVAALERVLSALRRAGCEGCAAQMVLRRELKQLRMEATNG